MLRAKHWGWDSIGWGGVWDELLYSTCVSTTLEGVTSEKAARLIYMGRRCC